MRRLFQISIAIILLLASPSPSGAILKGSSGASPSCPYVGYPDDGCASATGIYYAPVGLTGDPTVPVAKPTWAQFSAYARTSGQVWTTTHRVGGAAPNIGWNLPGIDYGVGPNQTVASMTDIANWTQGTSGCVYLSATDGYSATNNTAVVFTATASGTTLGSISVSSGV
jgi:hypothetical protein